MRPPCKPHLLRPEDLMYLVVWGGKRAAIVVWRKKESLHAPNINKKKINLCFFDWFFYCIFLFHFVFCIHSSKFNTWKKSFFCFFVPIPLQPRTLEFFFFCLFFLFIWYVLYGVAHHWNGISDSSDSASESAVQSFDEESVVHSDDK